MRRDRRRIASRSKSEPVAEQSLAASKKDIAKLELSSLLRNSACAEGHASNTLAQGVPSLESASAVADFCAAVQKGDLSQLVAMLAAQALTLDAAFTDFSRRSSLNAADFPQAAQTYSNLALKAQGQCRATVETLAAIKRGGRQTVEVIHVHEGAQAVIAHTINQRGQIGKSSKQPHAKGADAPIAALRSPDEAGQSLPLTGFEGKASVQDARREKSGRSNR